MSRIHKLVFAVDFSRGCQSLVPTVRRMVECWQAEVTLLHVIEAKKWPGRKQELERLMLEMRGIARKVGEKYVRCRLERGSAAERILEYIQANQVELAVVSSRGSSALRGCPIGSVADRVLEEAKCHVWLDWNPARSRSASGMYAHRVACALAHDESDEYVLRKAEDISGDLNAGLTVIQAVTPAHEKPLLFLREQATRDLVLSVVKGRIERLRRRFLRPPDVEIDVGSHASVVSRVIQRGATGLLVTGNLREAILAAESECPVMRIATPAAALVAAGEPETRYAVAGRSA